MTIQELQGLKSKVANGDLDIKGAFGLLNGDWKNKRSNLWSNPEWKTISSEKKLDFCTQCGTKEGIMVLQHFIHPIDFFSCKRAIQNELFEEAKRLHPFKLSNDELNQLKEKKNLCIKCGVSSIRFRKTMSPPWVCNYCFTEFYDPIIKEDYINPRTLNILQGKYHGAISKEIWENRKDYIELNAFQIYIDSLIRYKECRDEDTTTFCKKCAFMWDIKCWKLCDQCKRHYHSFGYEVCYTCNETLKKSATTN